MLIYLAIVENWYYSSVTLLSVDSFTIHVPVRTSAYPWELPQAFAFLRNLPSELPTFRRFYVLVDYSMYRLIESNPRS